ncbi:hypothetical protein [Pseudomonas sp. UBA2522]|uniref:hypothetical protein n=1 Tax=Pseudomonas TaxID=286 RepID=UPI00257FDC76|nr:hypothetical protein [Pseudomonas sp. UBA2522]
MSWLFDVKVSIFQMAWAMFFIALLATGMATGLEYAGYMLAGFLIEALAWKGGGEEV